MFGVVWDRGRQEGDFGIVSEYPLNDGPEFGDYEFPTPDELEKEMKRIIGILSKDGGYIISSTHAMPNDIPTENVLRFVDVCKNQKKE